VLALRDNEVQSCFPSEAAPEGFTGDHLLDYLNVNVPEDPSGHRGLRRVNDVNGSTTSLRFSRNAGQGSNRKNKKIAEYFLDKGIRAITFLEHDVQVVAAFDPSCICVLSKATDLGVHPFPGILTAGKVVDSRPIAT
jgi:hypothetical protein